MLTKKQVMELPVGRYNQAGVKGFSLLVLRPTNRYWMLRRQINNRFYQVNLGKALEISPAKALAKAAEISELPAEEFLKLVSPKQSGAEEQEKALRLTFVSAAAKYRRWCIDTGRYEEESKQDKLVWGRLERWVFPVYGTKFLDELRPKDVAKMAERLGQKKETARRCIIYTRQIFDWAKASDLVDQDNPANTGGALKYLLPVGARRSQNRGAIAVKDLPDFFFSLYSLPKSASKNCFLFSILTATRSGTVRAARWEQIDWEAKVWNIPALQLKVKANGNLAVPLAPEAIRFLQALGPKEKGWIFPNPSGDMQSDAPFSQIMHDMERMFPGRWLDKAQSEALGKPVLATQHGIARATFRTWAQDDELGNDRRFNARTAELCLHHKVQDAYNGAYERNTSFLRRKEMMDAWAAYCFSKVSGHVDAIDNGKK